MLEPTAPIRSNAEPGSMHRGRVGAGRAEPDTLPDLLLIERSRAGDPRAVEALIRRYVRRLFRIARSVLPDEDRAEAAVREACITAFADLSRYEPSTPSGVPARAGKFAAWLARLAFVQARAARVPVHAAPPSALSQEGSTALAVGIPIEPPHSNASLERAIHALPEVFRTVFVLRVIEGINGIETAASLALHQTTVRTRLYRALRRLSPEVVARVRATADLLAPSTERAERIVSRVLEAVSR